MATTSAPPLSLAVKQSEAGHSKETMADSPARTASIGSSTLPPSPSSYEMDEKDDFALPDQNLDDLTDDEDIERAQLLDNEPKKPVAKDSASTTAFVWMVVNTLATIGIVFTNKAIFSAPALKMLQLTFASFHFFLTWLTLYILSRPRFAMFTARKVAIMDILPLSIAMAMNVILPNLSLAFSTITFYQVARILLTPTVALMNFVMYKATLPRNAIIALIPACIGVAMVSYYDSKPSADASIKTTSSLGVLFAMLGIFASSLYTVWIASYHKKLQMSSMQLLYNQAPVASFMLLYVIPFVDTFPVWSKVTISRWVLICMSGLFACIINISQFFIIAQTGPVSSTVVGHVKTCSIVALGWMTSGRAVGDSSILGVLIALGGIIAYSVVMMRQNGFMTKS